MPYFCGNRRFTNAYFKVTMRVGKEYEIPENVLLETAGELAINKPGRATISDNGVLTAMGKGTIKLTYTQFGKKRTIMKIRIKK